jgi:hypothetical protein
MAEPLEIVVVDDELIVRKRLKPALEKNGYNVEVYDDGSGVLARLKEKVFDIVVTDVRMDDVDGIQVLEEVLFLLEDLQRSCLDERSGFNLYVRCPAGRSGPWERSVQVSYCLAALWFQQYVPGNVSYRRSQR